MAYVELSTDPGYMDQYMGDLFPPQTDLDRFLSVRERRREIELKEIEL